MMPGTSLCSKTRWRSLAPDATTNPFARILKRSVPRYQVGRKGVVADPDLHRTVLRRIAGFTRQNEWAVAGVCPAGLRGAEGNQEYFVHILTASSATGAADPDALIERAIAGHGTSS